ncbi:MAG TPA: glycosyltransferase family 1 protein [Acidimicrobiales bacterium]|nr:glycosyltransferase family 1 protein [Acidimicrobiales bacterium]
MAGGRSAPLRAAVDATPLLGARTGIGAFTAALLEHLADRPEVEVTAYGLTWRGRQYLAGAVPAGVRTSRRPMAARPLRMAWQRGNRPPIEWWTGPVDVVHGTNFVVPPAAGAASVVTVHDLTPVHYPELCDAATLAFPSLVRRAIARGAWVHTPSRFVAAEVVRHLGADAERVIAIPSGVPAVAPADAGLGQRLAGAERYLLALGTVEPRKDLPLLVQAFDAVAGSRPDVRLVLAGPDGWGADALRRAMAESRHGDRIVRLGWVDDESRAGLLRGAAVVAYPSRYEGFGFPPLEAMAAGVPVVATTAGALPEVLGDAATLVPVGDLDALAQALAALLDDAGVRRQRVAAGRRRVGAYRWEHTAGAMVDLYRRAAAERS